MFVLPFQVEFRLVRLPLVTLIVMLLCAALYWAQTQSDARWRNARNFVCEHADETLRRLLTQDSGESGAQCAQLVTELSRARDPQARIAEIAQAIADGTNDPALGGVATIRQSLSEFWQGAQRLGGAPPLTAKLLYFPRSWNPWHMVTAALAHASLLHLLGNVFFFFLFGATVEGILGSWRFTALLLGLALGTHTVYSIACLGPGSAPPTLGLSGVVFGVMGLFAYFLPDARIRSVVWFVFRFWITSLSALFVALWYVGGDMLSLMLSGNHGGINVVAHLSGAAIGILLGMTLYREDRDWVRIEARPHLQPFV